MSTGRVPNREADLARPRERKGGDVAPVSHGEMREVVKPEPNPEWLPVTVMLWESLGSSGMSDFYQNSDWAYAWLVFDEVNEYKKPRTTADGVEYIKTSGQMFQAIMSAMTALGMTEGDRRRMRIELDRPEPDTKPAHLVAIEDYKKKLGV